MTEPGREQDKTILVVDDEPRIVEAVGMNLELEGYQVSSASNGYEALQKLTEDLPDLVILDVMMPEIDGFETLRKIREVSTVPVIMLTVRGEEIDKVKGLDLGADDYITKPFNPKELVLRIRAVLRRVEMPSPVPKTEIRVDDNLSIDFSRCKVIIKGKEVHLRPTEYRLLYHLVSNAGHVLTHETLLRRVWGYEYRDEDHYLWLYITYLRKKIEDDPKHPKYILSERGIGYRFKEFGK
ncbi:MAG: DNA-binding response regulator [Dehalococcoidia bacterium CG2_30_46_19]|jgi:two-component system KDP operon response regulator KdpE|nr:MAG: DNA-binding response regulator [Dehalococcoidia bacterium CG2_30_46_19]